MMGGRVLVGLVLIVWAAAIFACGYLAVVSDGDKTRAAFVGLAGTLGAGFAAALAATANAWRADAQDAAKQRRDRLERVLDLARRYDAHRRRAHKHRADVEARGLDEAGRAALGARAWQENDAAEGVRDELTSAIELARGLASPDAKSLLTEVDQQLGGHDHWIPLDQVDELPIDRLRAALDSVGKPAR